MTFRKGVGGQRGLSRGTTSKARDSGTFAPLARALGEWGRISGELFGLFLGVCLSPTLCSKPPKNSPKGPKIEKNQDRPPGLKFSFEIFKRAIHQAPIFVGNSEGPGLKFSSEIEIVSIEIENFNRD